MILSDGSELTGVTSVTLIAEPGGVWMATITVQPERIGPISADAVIIRQPEPIPYQDRDVVEATTMEDLANGIRRYVRI